MYAGMRKLFGPTINKTAPVKSKDGGIISDRTKQMEQWADQTYVHTAF